ncbi:MAG: ArnT family glycosyltransferase [Thermodesulfobacteriota bacterium]
MDTRRKYILIIIVIGFVILFFNLGGRDLWEPDETRYAVVAREMRETGDWILPHLNGEIYAEKPPLFFWLVNLSAFFLGEDSELANRLPAALAGFATILLTFFFGERLFNTRVGFLSALILITCLFFPQISRWMVLDSLFEVLFLLALYCFYLGYEKEEGRRRYYLLAGVFVGLGVLTKGPVAYLTLPIFLIFTLLQRGLKKFWSYDLVLGFLLSLAVVLAWMIPACLGGGEAYTKLILVGQMVGRLTGTMKHFHPEPFHFYFPRLSVEFLPWVVFLPTAFICAFRQGEVIRRKEILFLTVWFVLILLFFTFVKGKKDNYILPLYPAAAILLGWFWDQLFLSQTREKGVIVGLLLLNGLVLVAFFVFSAGFLQKLYPAVMPYRFFVFSALSYLLVGLAASLICFVNGKKWTSFVCIVVTFAVLHLHISYSLPRRLNAERSVKAFSQRIVKRMDDGDELKLYFNSPTGVLYYTRKVFLEEIRSRDRFLEVFRSPQRVFIVIGKRELDRLGMDLNIGVKIIERVRLPRDLVLISNR